MAVFRLIFKIIAFVGMVGACNLVAAAKAEVVDAGKRYFSSQHNLRLHIIWSCIGIGIGIMILSGR